jgi:CDP-glycerol glycerophosphotransferase (TagB/SpsB family)
MILVMPTWRQWLEEQSAEAFRESEYYQRYAAFITSERLLALLERLDATLVFYIHPKLSEQITNFSTVSERVQLVPMGSKPLNEIMMECSALVTDYSSVCWDVLYMDKPVIYYHFDQARYVDEVGSYIDLNTELPGPVCKDTSEVVQAISDLIANDFTLSPEDVEKTNDWYAFKDTNNRKRTFDFLQERYPFD